jgi:hypothetical protein
MGFTLAPQLNNSSLAPPLRSLPAQHSALSRPALVNMNERPYLVGLVVLMFAPETKGKPLPE